MPAILARDVFSQSSWPLKLVTNVRINRTLLCAGCLNPTTNEYQVRVASDLISIFILKYPKYIPVIWQNVKEDEKQRNKVTIEKFNPKNRNFIGNIPEIFNRLLQRPRILFRQYCCVPFMQKKHAIRLQMKKKYAILSVSIIKGGAGRNSKTVRNSKKSLYSNF